MKYVWTLILLFLLSSCVSTESLYRDDFQGEWLCDHLPMGDFVDTVVLNIDDNEMMIMIDDDVYMKDYRIIKNTMVLDWTINVRGVEFLFLDATLTSDNELLLRWKPIDFWYPYTTIFKNI